MGPTIQKEEMRYCLYARKSTESDEKQALSIDSQIKEMLQIAERDGLTITGIRREAHSANGKTPFFHTPLSSNNYFSREVVELQWDDKSEISR